MSRSKYPFSKEKPAIIHPDYPKPKYAEACSGKFSKKLPFQSIRVRFWKNTSKMYNKAKYLCSLLPNSTTASKKNGYVNSFQFTTLEECYIYQEIWNKLDLLIFSWKYCEYYLNEQICYHDELYVYWFNLLRDINYSNLEIISASDVLRDFNNKWTTEKTLYGMVASMFPELHVIYHYRAEWLENLELDIFIEDLKIGIEYQGIQHYEIVEHWGGSAGLKKRQDNDSRKNRLCKQYGVSLVYFLHTETLTYQIVYERLLDTIQRSQQ